MHGNIAFVSSLQLIQHWHHPFPVYGASSITDPVNSSRLQLDIISTEGIFCSQPSWVGAYNVDRGKGEHDHQKGGQSTFAQSPRTI